MKRDRSYALCLANDHRSFWRRIRCWVAWLP